MVVYEVMCSEACWEGESWSEGLFERDVDANTVSDLCSHPHAHTPVYCDVQVREVHMTTADWKHDQFRIRNVVGKQMVLKATGGAQ